MILLNKFLRVISIIVFSLFVVEINATDNKTILLDASGSMGGNGYGNTNYYGFVKEQLARLTSESDTSNVTVVAFTDRVIEICDIRDFDRKSFTLYKGNTDIKCALDTLSTILKSNVKNQIVLVTDGKQNTNVSTSSVIAMLNDIKTNNKSNSYCLLALSDELESSELASLFDGNNNFHLIRSLDEKVSLNDENEINSTDTIIQNSSVAETTELSDNKSDFITENYWWIILVLILIVAIIFLSKMGLFVNLSGAISSFGLVSNLVPITKRPEFNGLSQDLKDRLLRELETNKDLENKIETDSTYIDKWEKAQNGRWYADPALNEDLRNKLGETGEYDIRGYARKDPAYKENALMTKEKLEIIHQYMPDGVQRRPDGTVDFTNAAIRYPDGKPVIVDIGELNPNSNKDRTKASNILFKTGFSFPEGFDAGNTTWHHIEGSTKLMLVRWDVHALIDHVGGRSVR